MDTERIIAEIEWLELLFSLPDTRPHQVAEWKAENQRHEGKYADAATD